MPQEPAIQGVTALIAELEAEFNDVCELGDEPASRSTATTCATCRSIFQCC
jgi:hypothetical protein